jgi:hypothetical protein
VKLLTEHAPQRQASHRRRNLSAMNGRAARKDVGRNEELVDNALDAFKSSAYEQSSSADKRIVVLWSSDNVVAADRQLEIADTGPGIDLSII